MKIEDVAVMRCTGRTKAGERCSNKAETGSTRCRQHRYALRGRPSKLTAELTAEICWLVLEGNYLDVAAQAVGVDRTTLRRWLRRGEEALAAAEEAVDDGDKLLGDRIYNFVDPGEWSYLDFHHALKSAEAFAETELLRKAQWPTTSAWQAFMTILERRHPQRWKRREAVEHEGGVAVRGELVVPAEDKVDKVVAILAEAMRSTPEGRAAAEAAGKTTTKRRTRKR